MRVKSVLWILPFLSLQQVLSQDDIYGDDYGMYGGLEPLSCSTTERIKDGHVSYSQGGAPGSVLTYQCGPGQYPYPVSSRSCGEDGEWSPMRAAGDRLVSRAKCKHVLCPAQLQLDHGDFWPMDQWFRVGATQSFSCQDGFTLSGSAQRNCTGSGEWTGTTPVCDNHADDCSDPGTPPGASRSAGRLHVGEKVSYLCQAGLYLLGSAQRVCLENREWSGSPPRCQGSNTYDTPSSVAAAMAGSLAGLMDVLSPEAKKKAEAVNFGRTFNVAKGSRMNIYILLDTSGSIQKQDFDVARNATIALIRKLDSYEVEMKFHLLSFATEAIDIVDIRESQISGMTENVIAYLMEFDYHSHGVKTGTNLYAALYRVSEMISFFKRSPNNHFNETQNIIIIETDGYSNTGKKPQIALAQIRGLLGYRDSLEDHTDETMLDVYVFGIGDQVKKDQLNDLASKKNSETHVFILKDFESLGQVFNSIISDKSVTMCGVAQEDVSEEKVDERNVFTKPWHVKVTMKTSTSCFGSIVSENWVLTAAHCFAKSGTEKITQLVDIEHGAGMVVSRAVFMHPDYNIRALRHRNVSEFYDYDVALVQLNKSIPLSWKARPICLPCTVPASRAMKNINSTCQQHRKALLASKETAAFFINGQKNPKRKETHIHTQSQRQSCAEKALLTIKEPTDVTLEEYVTDRFLCSGGSQNYQDAIACKGDSGGSLYLGKGKRYFQVGVLSWGVLDACDASNYGSAYGRRSNRPPPDARDFHIDLFKIMPWLKKHLGEEIKFLPEIN